MNARLGKVLILFLCGTLLFIAGCATTPPPPAVTPTPTGASQQVTPANTDMGTIIALLRSIDDQVNLVATNTKPQAGAAAFGNIVLFDYGGNTANTITNGSSVIALPQGTCDIAVYGDSVRMFITAEELKDYSSVRYNRNYQACADVYVCRRTVTLNSDFAYLFLTYKPYIDTYRLTRVTLSYRCNQA
ncbi:MAG TPA: hypothetical protein VMB35_04795 [Methanomicrobiales archaeon]|nr:hypothetical protein [Methanomicrobiales archaeon]